MLSVVRVTGSGMLSAGRVSQSVTCSTRVPPLGLIYVYQVQVG